jgi:hypothetical protein
MNGQMKTSIDRVCPIYSKIRESLTQGEKPCRNC